jgi:hypothetical protein
MYFFQLSDCSKVVGKVSVASREADEGTSVENADAVDCQIIDLKETSEGGNDSKDSQVAPGYRLWILMVERFGFFHGSVLCSYR